MPWQKYGCRRSPTNRCSVLFGLFALFGSFGQPLRTLLKTLKDAFGYSYYFAFILAPLPGILISAIKYFTKSKKGTDSDKRIMLSILLPI